MGRIKNPEPVILFCGIITRPELIEKLSEILSPIGEIEDKSEILDFNAFTDYYKDEMGENLLRLWLSIKGLISQENLYKVKLLSNEIEDRYSKDGNRMINIDPGYVSLSNVILFTTKNYSHRIYIGEGIYAEVTLIYKKKEGFTPLPWTYPDYQTEISLNYFNNLREKLKILRRG